MRAALRRQRAATPGSEDDAALLRRGTLHLDVQRRRVHRNAREIELTPSEFALLQAFMNQPDRVLTRARLIALAFGPDYDGLDRTIDTHILNLRRKLEGDRSQPRCIETVFGVGYRFVGEHA